MPPYPRKKQKRRSSDRRFFVFIFDIDHEDRHRACLDGAG